MSGQIERQPVLPRLADILRRPVSRGDRDRARRHLLDWTACAIAARQETVATALRQGTDQSTEGCAFVWGGLGNVLEMDDVDKRALLHPGPTIIPAVLALARDVDSTTDEILDAIVVGYDATIRLGRAVGAGHYALWHNTGTCGPIGAAAACGTLLRLDHNAMTNALALAMSQSSGLWQTRHEPHSMGKQLHTAHAARAGLHAARLAAAGMHGPRTILEGAQGFFAASCEGAQAENVLNDYPGWLIHDVSFKPWPACRHAHAAIDAALVARTRGLSGDHICVSTYRDALQFCDRPYPSSMIEAKFSLQHAVAVAFVRGEPQLSDFEQHSINDAQIRAVRETVAVTADDALDVAYPAHFGARLDINGQSITVSDALGDPENPLSDEALISKARMLMEAGGCTPEFTERMIGACLRSEASDGEHRLLYEAIGDTLP
ncbi:MAG: MmgE/PrpD family protein [Pseudomonadota bacterium]